VPETQAQLSPTARRRGWLFFAAQLAAFALGLALTIPTERARWGIARHDRAGVIAWFFEFHLDTTLPFLLLVVAPLCWMVRRRPSDSERLPDAETAPATDRAAWVMALACFATSLGASAWVASQSVGEGALRSRFGDLPPAYHDEFSYLLQAKTFLAGRLSYPSSPQLPELFDQMHVVNEGRFASRYFPGVGAWIAPFFGLGHPYWAQWLGGALAAFFTFWAGRELAGNRIGLFAGSLTALSPGIALFDNLLLSHAPTIAALMLFLFAFLRFMRTGGAAAAFWAGCGLSLAMLCRPMTAAGFGLPFGIWMLARLASGLRQPAIDDGRRLLRSALCLAAPLIVGLTLLFFYNRAITGSGFVSPYQLYTDTYTPRHVYGFNNVVRRQEHIGPRVIDNYDRWAKNLDSQLALANEVERLEASARWTLALVPIALAAVIFLIAVCWTAELRWKLVAASVVSLHAVHVPYWFVGIMGWHYVFESAPLLLLLFALTTRELFARWRASGRVVMPAWWGVLVASAVLTNWVAFDPFWSTSRIESGVEEVAFARLKYEAFREVMDRALHKPALLLIKGDPGDRSIDYVYNDPDLKAPILRGRYRPDTDLNKVRGAFPNRSLYLLDVKTSQLRDVTAPGRLGAIR
jgi:hypothetical protein